MAAMPLAFTSCSSSDDDNTTYVITPSNSEFADEAKKLNFSSGIELSENEKIKSIELSESGRYLVRLLETESSSVKTRAGSEDYDYITGFYHILTKGSSYRLEGFGDLTLDFEGSVIHITIKLINGHEISVDATPQDIITVVNNSQSTKNLCQYWKVDKTRLRLTNKKGLKLARDFEGCNLREIKKYIEENSDCRVDETFDTKWKLTNMNFDQYHTFQLDYTDGIDVGTWNWVKESDGTLRYVWEGREMGNKFEAGSGIVVFKSEKECWLTIDAVLDTDGTDYDVTMTYILSVVSTK